MNTPDVNYRRILQRGLRKRCPHCGQGELFESWFTLHERCPDCNLPFEASDGSTWAFMYISTAAVTGLVIVIMLLLGTQRIWMWRFIVLPVALGIIGWTLPVRKSIAVALEYTLDLRFDRFEEPPKELEQQEPNDRR